MPRCITIIGVVVTAGLFSAPVHAQTAPLIPYQGRLEVSGAPASGPHDFRFALFSTAGAPADCLVLEAPPATCGTWWGEVSAVNVSRGAFSAMLGEAPYVLSSAVLAASELWLAIAVKPTGDATFRLLAGKQRVADVPRAAAALDFKVSGDLRVDGNASVGGTISGNGVVPIGGIIMWSGPIAAIPANFSLCDGTNGTPDLQGRFIVGYAPADADHAAVGKLGGAKTHLHSVTHDHPSVDSGQETNADVNIPQGLGTTVQVANDDHVHPVNLPAITVNTAPSDGRPPFYTLAFIMRTE